MRAAVADQRATVRLRVGGATNRVHIREVTGSSPFSPTILLSLEAVFSGRRRLSPFLGPFFYRRDTFDAKGSSHG